MSKWIFCQYTAGAGGKVVSICSQTAESVVPWFKQKPDPTVLASRHTNDSSHVRVEPDTEYRLAWLSRSHGVDRGHHLEKSTVDQMIENDQELSNLTKNKKILVSWSKNELPTWFDGQLIQIINDDASLSWLLNRRIKIFYVESDEGIIETRYDSRYHNRPDRNDRCVSPLPLNSLAEKQMIEENILPNSSATHIQLSWLLNKKWPVLFDTLENAIKDKVDRVWCEEYLNSWHKKVIDN